MEPAVEEEEEEDDEEGQYETAGGDDEEDKPSEHDIKVTTFPVLYSIQCVIIV